MASVTFDGSNVKDVATVARSASMALQWTDSDCVALRVVRDLDTGDELGVLNVGDSLVVDGDDVSITTPPVTVSKD